MPRAWAQCLALEQKTVFSQAVLGELLGFSRMLLLCPTSPPAPCVVDVPSRDSGRCSAERPGFDQNLVFPLLQAAADPLSLLLFSGGQTRQDAGPRSEGASYWQVAEAAGWFGSAEVRARSATEETARDSFENVLFSLCRFYQLTGHYPHNITVVRPSSLVPRHRCPRLCLESCA